MLFLGPWTTDDFATMSWHDVHVHGFWLDAFESDQGVANLNLDIDYILEWQHSRTRFQFTVCQAHLRFHEVSGLKLTLDYPAGSVGMCPFAISGIERQRLGSAAGRNSYHWRLPFNWPLGLLEFDAPGFEQALTGTPQVQASQWLEPGKRLVLKAS